MGRYLTSFSGKFGDILWSLPTVRAISQIKGEPVDMAIMPQYKSLLPLLQAQPYIDKAFVIEDWLLQHSNHGDQPAQHPVRVDKEYEQSFPLAYRAHPGMSGQPNMCLVDFIAWQQGIRFVENPIPFLKSFDVPVTMKVEGQKIDNYVAFAFNDMYKDLKMRFLKHLELLIYGPGFPIFPLLGVMDMSWLDASVSIDKAMAFVGDRSALHVIAHGVGQRLITYEPHPARNKQGHLGTVFGCPYGRETALPLNMSPEQAAERTVELLKEMKEEEKECA